MENEIRPTGEDIDPVSRKTNEEIETDDAGQLLIHGQPDDENKSRPSDGPISEDLPKGTNSLGVED